VFPPVKLNGYVGVKIKKGNNSVITVKNRLIFEPFIYKSGETVIALANNAKLLIENDFVLGDGIRILVEENATLLIKGKDLESGSGITSNSVIMVKNYLEIGKDCLLAWDLFLTDCDWHGIEKKVPNADTIIGDHVWIGVGAKVLKGTRIGSDSIVTSNSVVLQGTYEPGSMVSGNPAKVVKANIPKWTRDMYTKV
jgi:acetyltransferase-like isoleucine patch superfamily enzyme